MSPAPPFRFACPLCSSPLESPTAAELRCPLDETLYCQVDGIWNFFPPQLHAPYRQFIQDYEFIRQAEGRGDPDPAYYRALPYEDLSGRFVADWRIRARSFAALLARVVEPAEKLLRRPLRVLDLGAGNGWLSYRMAQRGHHAAAVDLQTGAADGLGAWVHYDASFTPLHADFDHLPFQPAQFDLAVFNASLHYSTRYETSLRAAWNLLVPGGRLAILDSPVYRNAESGAAMVREREARFTAAHGRRSDALPSENFLTWARLEDLSHDLGACWEIYTPFYGLEWALRPWKARLKGSREPARFALIATRKPGGERR